MPLEVNLVNLVDILYVVSDVVNLGLHLGVPKYELDKIRQDFHTTDERKREMLQWWLNHTLNPTWEKVKAALGAMHEPKLAAAVTLVSQRESLYEPCEEESKRWEENLKKIESLDTKLQKLKQRSEDLEKKWEKGEKEWRKYLKKLEENWEDLVICQQTQQGDIFTLGMSQSELSH